jgi:metal-responsive CopG/Arc/MetJ family transcriptional regulator
MKTIAITIDTDMLQRLDRLAAHGGRGGANRSRVIRTAVKEYLARLEAAAEAEHERAIFRRHSKRLARQSAALVREQARP